MKNKYLISYINNKESNSIMVKIQSAIVDSNMNLEEFVTNYMEKENTVLNVVKLNQLQFYWFCYTINNSNEELIYDNNFTTNKSNSLRYKIKYQC